MSRVGKQIIEIPDGVSITVDGLLVKVKGPKGELSHTVPECVHLKVEGSSAQVNIDNPQDRVQNVLWGTNTSLISNMVKGVKDGYTKQLEVNGVGYKVASSGQKLTLNIGFSHSIDFAIPQGIEAKIEKNLITISGIDKQQVGQIAAQIRKLRPPEPYKGKGIKYVDEIIRRKAGKTAVGGET